MESKTAGKSGCVINEPWAFVVRALYAVRHIEYYWS